MTEPEPPVGWRVAAIWAAPIALWLSLIAVVGVVLPWQWHEWRNNVAAWPDAIAESRTRGDTEMAAKQEAWLARDQRNGVLTVAALGAVLALALAAPFAVRKLVPRSRRPGRRGFLLAVPALALLALVGYLALATLLHGVIKG